MAPGVDGISWGVRLKFTLSYAGLVLLAGSVLLAAVSVFLLRYVPDGVIQSSADFVPNRSDLIRAFAPAAAASLILLLVIGLAGGWLLAGRMLAPVTRISEAARRAAEGSLTHRIRLGGPRDEFRELADTFDDMLARLEAHVGEQQRFAANASHELRTPLATVHALLEVARKDPDVDIDVLLARLDTVNGRAIGLTEALLLLARGERALTAAEPVDLSLLVEEATETLLPAAESRDVTITVTGEPAIALGSEQLLLQLVMNLVDNAVVYNDPEGGSVLVHTSAWHGVATLRVENSGAVLAPGLVATLAEPFQRGVERIRGERGHDGVGLGLAIVRSIAATHGGSLALKARSGGGLVATVKLPLAQPVLGRATTPSGSPAPR